MTASAVLAIGCWGFVAALIVIGWRECVRRDNREVRRVLVESERRRQHYRWTALDEQARELEALPTVEPWKRWCAR